MANLKRLWAIWVGSCGLALAAAAGALYSIWGLDLTLRWLLATGGLLVYQLAYLRRYLDENRDIDTGNLHQHLGPANWLTVIRGALLTFVAGFLLVPRPEGWLAWVPALLYLGAMLIDYVDGYAARVSGVVTRLGSRMDMHFDGHGYMIGGLLLVVWGQAPVWYLLVALARPLYVLGEKYLAWRNQPLRPLYPNPFRRPLSGAQMGFTTALMFPVFTPPGTTIAATLYMLPFLANFLLDWLWVSGTLPESFMVPGRRRARWLKIARAWIPLLLRAGLVVLLAVRMQQPVFVGLSKWFSDLLHSAAILAALTGSAGRVIAVAMMLFSGFYLRTNAGDLLSWCILLVSLGLFFGGTGRFSLWTPENWLIYRIAGEKAES